jgi:DNA-binding XRE family transcriptional regulator
MRTEPFNPVAHDAEFSAKLMGKPGVAEAYAALEEEYALIEAFIEARKSLGLTQDIIAKRMGTTRSAVSRLEAALGDRRHSPSLTTLRKYAKACGKRLEVRLV